MIVKKINFSKCFLFFNIICVISNNCLSNVKDLYLNLIKKCLINHIYQDKSICQHAPSTHEDKSYDFNLRESGRDWPSIAHTMIGLKRLNNIQFCVEAILKNKIPGDFIETGVWRGGATIFMRSILKVYDNTERKVWVADSFEGLPKPNAHLYPKDENLNLYKFRELSISLEEVKENFKRYGLLDNQVKFLKGWFKDTLPKAPIKRIALLRLDGDLYESTMDTLKNLYHKVSIGGYVIIDDYQIPACRAAISDFRKAHNIDDLIKQIDGFGVFWRKTK